MTAPPTVAEFGAARVVPVDAAFRFDLTLAVMRGFAANIVDRVTPEGSHVRAHVVRSALEVWSTRRRSPLELELRITGRDAGSDDEAALRRRLGVDRSTPRFDAVVRQIPWLARFVCAAQGLRPSQVPTLWEACAHAIVFQSVSMFAATAILQRTIAALEGPFACAGTTLYAFPSAERFAAAPEAVFLGAGLSRAKAAALVCVARAIGDGTLDETQLAGLSTPQIFERLQRIRGVGPWTAAVVALRAFGRLDTFPPGDSGIAANLSADGATAADLAAALAAFGDERGMLYHYAHLERIVRAGDAVL